MVANSFGLETWRLFDDAMTRGEPGGRDGRGFKRWLTGTETRVRSGTRTGTGVKMGTSTAMGAGTVAFKRVKMERRAEG